MVKTIGKNVVLKIDGKDVPVKKRGKYYYTYVYIAECKKCGISKRIDHSYLNNPKLHTK